MYRGLLSILLVSLFFISDLKAQSQYVYTRIDINPGSGGSRPLYITGIDSLIYFFADDGTHGWEPWVSDGTQAGTRLLKDLTPGQLGGHPYQGVTFIKYNGKVYFSGHGPDGYELWETDGTTAGTKLVKDINPGPASSNPTLMAVCNGLLYFSALNDTYGREPWVSDGTTNGTILLKDIRTSSSGHSIPEGFTEFNGKTYFGAYDGLWQTDGTPSGTVIIKSPSLSSLGEIEHFTIFKNKLYFSAAVGAPYAYGLLSTDGTPAGTVFVANTEPTSTDPISSPMTIYKNELYFSSSDGFPNHSDDFWKSDGVAPLMTQVKDIYPGKNGASDPESMEIINNKILFGADDSTHGKELWSSDGTEAGTKMVIDIRKQPVMGSGVRKGIKYGDKYFFIADDTGAFKLGYNYVAQLYVSDGTDTGTHKLVPPYSTDPYGFGMHVQDNLYMTVSPIGLVYAADYDTTGVELIIITDTTIKDTTTPPQTVAQVSGTDNEITITPNPAHDNVHIALAKAVTNAEVTLTDISGKVVLRQTIKGVSKDIDFTLPNTTPGIYILNIQDVNGTLSQRLLIE